MSIIDDVDGDDDNYDDNYDDDDDDDDDDVDNDVDLLKTLSNVFLLLEFVHNLVNVHSS